MEKENHSAEKKPMREYTPWDYVKPGIAIAAFAVGAMLYVVVEELIPEMSAGEHSNIGTIFFAVGFTLMMILDVALG